MSSDNFTDFDLDLADRSPESEEWKQYESSELKKDVSDRWRPPSARKLARELYGAEIDQDLKFGKTAFVIGCGPSISKAERYLKELPEGSFRVGVNRAVLKVPCEYTVFIDYPSYQAVKGSKTKLIGVDRFWPLYGPEVYIFERAYTFEDLAAGRILHRSTSLIAAIHIATWLGASRIVTIGCDLELEPDKEYTQEYKDIMGFTFKRVAKSLRADMPFWRPSWLSLADASGGQMPLPPTTLHREFDILKDKLESSRKPDLWLPSQQ